MRWWSRASRRQLQRRLLAPLRRIESRARSSAERFVLKTIEKNGIPSAASNVSGSALPQEGLPASLLLQLLRSKRRPEPRQRLPMQAIAIGEYLLAAHPRRDFFYHRPVDLVETPWILQGDYQPNVTAWICAHVPHDARILLVGGGEGYHALSLASQLDASGRVLALTLDEDLHAVFELNIKLHRLENQVALCATNLTDLQAAGHEIRSRIESFAPTLTLLELPNHAFLDGSWVGRFGLQSVVRLEDAGVSLINTQPTAVDSRRAA